jgi:HlyD family secretion protein
MSTDRKRKILAAVVIGVVVIGTVIAVLSHVIKTDARKARFLHSQMPVRVVPVKISTLEQVVGAEGEVAPVSIVNLTMPLSGVKVKKVGADVGAIVRAGDILAEFDEELVKADLDSKKDAVAKAETDIEKAKQTVQANDEGYEAALRSAQDQVSKA